MRLVDSCLVHAHHKLLTCIRDPLACEATAGQLALQFSPSRRACAQCWRQPACLPDGGHQATTGSMLVPDRRGLLCNDDPTDQTLRGGENCSASAWQASGLARGDDSELPKNHTVGCTVPLLTQELDCSSSAVGKGVDTRPFQ